MIIKVMQGEKPRLHITGTLVELEEARAYLDRVSVAQWGDKGSWQVSPLQFNGNLFASITADFYPVKHTRDDLHRAVESAMQPRSEVSSEDHPVGSPHAFKIEPGTRKAVKAGNSVSTKPGSKLSYIITPGQLAPDTEGDLS